MLPSDAFFLAHRRFVVGAHHVALGAIDQAARHGGPRWEHATSFASRARRVFEGRSRAALEEVEALLRQHGLPVTKGPTDAASWEAWSASVGASLFASLTPGSIEGLAAWAGTAAGQMMLVADVGQTLVHLRATGELWPISEAARLADERFSEATADLSRVAGSEAAPALVRQALGRALELAVGLPMLEPPPGEGAVARYGEASRALCDALLLLHTAWPGGSAARVAARPGAAAAAPAAPAAAVAAPAAPAGPAPGVVGGGKVRRVGFFRELRHGHKEGPSLRDAVRAWAREDEGGIVAYLRGCPVLIASPGRAKDVLDPGGGRAGTGSVKTDGVWAWPDDLPHYVERYHVELPAEFLAHISARKYQVPRGVDEGSIDF
jgi:hypothetical protein